eukprot:5406582-Heterocapsa_arctica.AAC.1
MLPIWLHRAKGSRHRKKTMSPSSRRMASGRWRSISGPFLLGPDVLAVEAAWLQMLPWAIIRICDE